MPVLTLKCISLVVVDATLVVELSYECEALFNWVGRLVDFGLVRVAIHYFNL